MLNLEPFPPVLYQLKQKVSLMTSMRNMPYLSRYIMSFCSGHISPNSYILIFGPKIGDIGPKTGHF